MASSGIYIKFKIFSATDTYFAVGSSSRGSFNKKLGTGAELLAGRNDSGIENGIEVFASIDLGGTFGNFNVRLYAENELGIRSPYDEKVTQVMGNDLGDNTFSFADVFCSNSEVIERSMDGTMFTHDNNVNISLNFSGNAPQVAWTLFAPPGHPAEGEVLSSNETFDRLLRGFDLCFYREGTTAGTWEKIDSDSDRKTIQDAYPNWDYKDGKWWIGFLFEIDIYADLFKALAGTNNPRKIKLEITARTITFAADATEKTCTLNLILENEKTKLLSKFINTIKNDLHFSFEVDDIDFNKLLVKQYIKNADSDWVLSSKKEVANLSSAEKKSASVVLPQKWSNGRGSSIYRNQYQYIIEVYDAFGLSSVYCPKTSGALDEISSNYTVTDTTGKIFESIVKINKINIASVGNAFDVSWNLTDINGNSVSFKEDELDQIAVVKGIVGYFHDAGGSHVVDAFDVSDTNRFETSILKSDLRMVDLKQETFRTLVDNVTFEENARIQNGLYGNPSPPREASRTLQFTLAILDAAGEIIDEETVSATNAQPAIKQDGFSFDVFETIGSVKFNLEFNEKINHIEIYRRPELNTTTDLKYAQKSPSGTGSGDYSMTEDTVRASQYNTSTTLVFGEDVGTKNRSTAAGYDFISSEYLVKTQTTEGTNSLSINDSNQCTLIDENVPMLRDEGVLENFTEYDYILVPYDGFGAGVPFIVDSVNVASYKLFSRNDQGFVGVLDTKAPEAPTSGEVKTSFKNWFLTWTPASDGEKSVEYKVTMVRDLRTAQEIDAGTAVSFTKNTNSNYTKWSRDVTGAAVNDLHMATIFKADGSKAEVSIVENNSDSIYLDRFVSNISETSGALTLDGYDSTKVTVEQFFCSTPSLQIEGETNQTGYFFIEAIDKTGNHSKFLQLDSGFTLGQTKITDIATFEQDITGKIPGSIALVPKDPFSVSGSTLSWSDHFIYKDGEAHYIKQGSISLTKALFVGDDIPSSVIERFDEWGQANANRFIKYVYWNPDGGYDTTTNQFKEKVTASDTVAWKKLNSVDQNITFESQGYYSFSMFNPSSASYNIVDSGNSALYNGTGLTHEDYFGSTSVQKKNLDLEIFNDTTWETYRKYGAGNAGSTDEVNKGIRKHYGIHMPLEAEGEVNSHGQRTPLVKSNSGGNAGGSIVIARINKINGEYSVSSAWHSFANAVIGSAMIDQASIKSAHINDLTADTITGGTIRGHEIILGEKAEEANQHENTVNNNTKFSKYGIIKSENYAGIYSSVPGFWINGDGTFSFSTSSGSSLSFEDNELVLRGRLVQPSGAPVATINLNCDTETIIFDEVQVEGHPEASLIEDPTSEKVNFTVDVNNAIFSDGTPLTSAQFRVKVYPGDLSTATGKSLDGFKSSTSGNCYLSDVYDATAVTFDNSEDINEGFIKFELNFTDYDSSNDQGAGKYNHKFLSKTDSTISIPDFFTVDVELFFDSGLISYDADNEYYSGDVVIHGGNSYTALQNVPKGESISDTSYWQNNGAGSERIVATQRKIIRSFIEPSSALVYELKATPGSQIMQNTPFGSGVQSEVNIFGNYGTESRAKLDETVTDVWALNGLDYIKIYRKTILTTEAKALVTPFNTSSSYDKGDIVTHSGNTYISIADSNTTTPPAITGRVIGDLDSSKWNPISEVLIGKVNASQNAIEYINFGLSNEETGSGDHANKIYRESFGFNKVAALQVNFTAEYDDAVIVQETVDMVPSGMNAGVLTFHENAARTDASLINVIGRNISNRKVATIGKTVYWKAVYSSGNNTIASELEGHLTITGTEATPIFKSGIVESVNSDLYTTKIDVDDATDVKRISVLITSVASGASAKEEISIVNEIDVPRNLNVVIPRQFIFFSREQGSVKQNVLRLENVVPFQVLYGQENAPINSDDVLAVVPSFGYIVNGKAMAGILENDTYNTTMNFGDVEDAGTYGVIKTEFDTAIPTLIGPRKDSVQEYQIYKEDTVWGFKEKVDTGSTISEIDIKNSQDYYYLIPRNASGDVAAARAGKISVKATLQINDQGIAASKITFKDVQQFNMIELAKDGENPLLSSASNSSITANADESKNIVNATRSAGLSVIEVFRGNKKVFLAPNKITFTRGSNNYTFTLDTTVAYIKYTGSFSSVSEPNSFSFADTQNNPITIANSSIENFESISSSTATQLIVENSTTNLPSDDARKRKVVLLNSSGEALAHFTMNWEQEGYELSLSVDDFIQPFSSVDQSADNIDCSIANLSFDKDVALTQPSTSPSASKPLVTLYTRNNQVEACIDLSGMNEVNRIKDTNGDEHTSMSFGFPVKVYISRLSQLQTLTTRMNLGVSQQGKAGPSFQFRGGYSADAKYYGDDVSQDMVTYQGPSDTEPKFYYVNRGFTKANGGYDSTTNSSANYIRGLAPGTTSPKVYWNQIENELQPTATSLLLADDILVKKGIVVGIATEGDGDATASGFIASQLEPQFMSLDLRGNIIDNSDFNLSATGDREAQVFDDSGRFVGLSDLGTAAASGKAHKTPRDFNPGFFLGSHPATYAKTTSGTETFLTSQLEMYSPFGNYLRWDGKNLIIKGGLINASVKDETFSIIHSTSSLLTLAPANNQVGNQTFIGGGFNNKIFNGGSVDLFPTLASSIVGGGNNVIFSSNGNNARFSSICGGFGNAIGDSFSTIGGGYYNSISVDRTGDQSASNTEGINAILSGSTNSIEDSSYSFIGSGYANSITESAYGSILNGFNNYIGGGIKTTSISVTNYESNDVVSKVYVKGFAEVNGKSVDVLNDSTVTNNERYRIILEEKYNDEEKIADLIDEAIPSYVTGWATDSEYRLFKSIKSYKLYMGFDKSAHFANEAFNIFNELTFDPDNQHPASSNYRTYGTGYFVDDNKSQEILIRVGYESKNNDRSFKVGYIDGSNFEYFKVKTHTNLWPYVKINGKNFLKAGCFKINQNTLKVVVEDVNGEQKTIDSLVNVSAGLSTAENASSNPVSGVSGTPTEGQISLTIPDPVTASTSKFSFNSIFGGDYNQIVSSRRSTVVGGRNNKIKFVERALVSGVDNLIIGEVNGNTGTTNNREMPEGFIVFGRSNQALLSGYAAPNYTDSWRAINSQSGTPTDYGGMANVIFGGANLVRNCSRTTILGSSNELLYKRPDEGVPPSQTGSEITILGTDNKIRVAEQAEASNLGIFGTNFTLTTPEMIQNTFYIGNPQVDDSVDIAKLTRVFVAADGGAFFTGDVISFALSDRRYKENIKSIENPLDKVLKISGVEFDWKDNQNIYKGKDVGVIAQEIKQVLPEVIEEGRLGLKVKYEKITPLLIEAIKEQQSEIKELKSMLSELKSAVDKLK